ncbi:MAG: hypothetical protein M3229_05345 [Actinomycetota bacterium]|nr:hypothetical protein [Actinomycetota bacterium]
MRAALAIVCAIAFLAGCGDDDDEATVVETTTVTTTETVPAPSEPDATTPAEPDADAPDTDGAAEAPGKCGRVTFEPNTDSGAFEIAAVGTDCTTARAVARAARNSTSELTYTAHGFSCTGARSDEPGLSSIEWFCFGADREVVTFATS